MICFLGKKSLATFWDKVKQYTSAAMAAVEMKLSPVVVNFRTLTQGNTYTELRDKIAQAYLDKVPVYLDGVMLSDNTYTRRAEMMVYVENLINPKRGKILCIAYISGNQDGNATTATLKAIRQYKLVFDANAVLTLKGYANTSVEDGGIETAMIRNGAVTAEKINAGVVSKKLHTDYIAAGGRELTQEGFLDKIVRLDNIVGATSAMLTEGQIGDYDSTKRSLAKDEWFVTSLTASTAFGSSLASNYSLYYNLAMNSGFGTSLSCNSGLLSSLASWIEHSPAAAQGLLNNNSFASSLAANSNLQSALAGSSSFAQAIQMSYNMGQAIGNNGYIGSALAYNTSFTYSLACSSSFIPTLSTSLAYNSTFISSLVGSYTFGNALTSNSSICGSFANNLASSLSSALVNNSGQMYLPYALTYTSCFQTAFDMRQGGLASALANSDSFISALRKKLGL